MMKPFASSRMPLEAWGVDKIEHCIELRWSSKNSFSRSLKSLLSIASLTNRCFSQIQNPPRDLLIFSAHRAVAVFPRHAVPALAHEDALPILPH